MKYLNTLSFDQEVTDSGFSKGIAVLKRISSMRREYVLPSWASLLCSVLGFIPMISLIVSISKKLSQKLE